MKLLVVAPYFYPKTGGLENYAFNIARGIKAKGWEVTVVCSNHASKTQSIEKIEGLKIYRLPFLFKLSNTPINFKWYRTLCRIIEKEKPDVINAHTPVPFISDLAARIAKKKGIKFVLTYHNDLVKQNRILNQACKLYYSILGNKTIENADKIIVTSEHYAKKSPFLKGYFSKTRVVSPGVEIARFNPKVNRKWLKKKYGMQKNKIVLFVGQLDKTHSHKGLDLLIEAIAKATEKVPELRLVVVGKGDWLEHYKKTAASFGVKKEVLFTGFVSDNELPYYYAGADATILAPLTNAEGFGMTLIESLACGTQVVGSDIGGIPSALKNGQLGLLVEPGSSDALTIAIRKVILEKSVPKKLASKDMKDFCWENKTKKTMRVFDEIL